MRENWNYPTPASDWQLAVPIYVCVCRIVQVQKWIVINKHESTKSHPKKKEKKKRAAKERDRSKRVGEIEQMMANRWLVDWLIIATDIDDNQPT